jgi:tetratricopeptide (TPR) repeat protein
MARINLIRQEILMPEDKKHHTIAEWFEKGRERFRKPDGMGAVKALERVIDMDPGYCHSDGDNPYFYLGKISEVEGRLDDAILHYSRAISVNALDEESLIGRGSCYTVIKHHKEAIADFTKVLHFPDEQRRAERKHLLYAIAENYRQMEDWQNALDWAKEALAADPDNFRHQQLVAEISEQIQQ